MNVSAVLNDINAAERAYQRVREELEAVRPEELTAMNIDVVSATSTVLGVAERIFAYREALADLPGFDVKCVDKLVDYATAAWYVFITNLPTAKPEQLDALVQECTALRGKLLMWAEPLVGEGHFDADVIAKIKAGSGHKDVPGDVVALVGLYRSKWEAVENKCAVTVADLDRGAQIGPYLFAVVSQKEQRASRGSGQDSQRVRAAWTLLDRAYDQCRRGLTFLLWKDGAVERVAPSLRRNPGARSSAESAPAVVPLAPPPAPSGAAPIGGGESPFASAGG